MQIILDSSLARKGSVPIWGGKKGEFRDWTNGCEDWRSPSSDSQGLPAGTLRYSRALGLRGWRKSVIALD